MKHQATKEYEDNLLAAEWNAEHVLTSGLDSAKPSSGLTVGQLYWATDTKILYRATSSTSWQEILRGETVSRLAQLSEKSHANLSGVTASQHHTKTVSGEISLAALAEKSHNSLTNVTASQHHTKTVSSDIDHGSVQGLGDDDHTQYLKKTATSNLDMAKHFISNWLIQSGSSYPMSPTMFQVFFRSDLNKFCIYTGSAWKCIELT
jgi:hypothetical protein